VSFFGISFNDQSTYAWFALLAIIAAATAPILQIPATETTSQVANGTGLGTSRLGAERPRVPSSVISVR
jgi:hypothetical protein